MKRLAGNLAILRDNDCLMAAFGNVDPYDEQGVASAFLVNYTDSSLCPYESCPA